MDTRFPGTIVWISVFYNRTGLAGGSRAIVKALHNAGMKIKIVPVSDVQPGIDDCDINFLKSLEQTPVIPPVTAIFYHNPSKTWLNVKLPEPHVRMMLTGFIGDNVPPDWIDICNSMDQVGISTRTGKYTWITSGINPELSSVTPGMHPWQFLPIAPLGVDEHFSADRIFRFLSLGTFSPNRRWDALIQAYLEEFSGNDLVRLRTYLYVIVDLLCFKWIHEKSTIPNMSFQRLLDYFKELFSSYELEILQAMFQSNRKSNTPFQRKLIPMNKTLEKFLNTELASQTNLMKTVIGMGDKKNVGR